MPARVRLLHRMLGTFHVFTSPDVQGLHVTGDTEADAQRAVVAMVDAIAAELGEPRPAVEFLQIADAA